MTRKTKAKTASQRSDAEPEARNVASKISFLSIKTIWIPRSETDYQILQSLGVPMLWISEDSKPLIVTLLNRREIEHDVSTFRDLEAKTIAKVAERWQSKRGYEFHEQGSALVFSGRQDTKTEERFSFMSQRLRDWYSRFHVDLDVQTRIRRKTGTATITYKVTRSFAPYIVF